MLTAIIYVTISYISDTIKTPTLKKFTISMFESLIKPTNIFTALKFYNHSSEENKQNEE